VIDLVALVLFWQRKEAVGARAPKMRRFGEYVSAYKNIWFAAMSGALSLVLLPRLMDLLSWIGPYHFQTEFSFCAILYLHLIAIFAFLIGRVDSVEGMLREKGFLILCASVVAFLALCFIVGPIGLLFDLSQNPFGYAILAFVHSIIFALVYYLLQARKGRGKE
jgi:hypothetical protein